MAITIKQVASAAGLSKSTISKYVNGGNVEAKNRAVIEKVIAELGFTPNLIAKGLKTSRTYTVGVLIPKISDVFSATVVEAMEKVLHQSGYGVIACGYESGREIFREKLRFLVSKMIDSLVVFPGGITAEDIILPDKRKIPVVLVDRPLQGFAADTVMTDNAGGGRQAIEYLVKKGHRKIAVLSGSKTSFTSSERLAGCIRAFSDNGITGYEDYVYYGVSSFESGFENMEKVLRQGRATAVFATNYYITFGALNALNAAGLAVPDDLSFIGFDNHDLYKLFKVPLTTVSQDIAGLGITAAHTVLRRVTGDNGGFPESLYLGTGLVAGGSVKDIG